MDEKELSNVKKVRDHCHFTGKFRGAAHNSCNLLCKAPKFFPVIFHNLSGYDAHLFIMKLGMKSDLIQDCDEIKCIASNEEKYISFSKNIIVRSFFDDNQKKVNITREIRFIDSYKFIKGKLGTLVSNLDPKDCNILHENFGDNLNLVLRKGVYPYDYMDSLEKFKETKLPPIENFYSKLNDESILLKKIINMRKMSGKLLK